MANAKEVRTQIRSIQNTQKITRAMEMVAASKMRKAQDRVKASRPYAGKIREVIANLAQANPEYHHVYMEGRELKRVGVIIVSTDRGLCGGLNNNLFKTVVGRMKEWDEAGVDIDVGCIGTKSSGFFKRIGASIVSEVSHLGDAPSLDDLIGTMTVMLNAYQGGSIDQLFVAYSEYVNTMTQSPVLEQLLPISSGEFDQRYGHAWDYIYEPDANEVLDHLLLRYLESLAYQTVVENVACEQAARMVAMKSASDNAATLIDELQLIYNKARQAAITQELAEIVAGADAV